MSVAAVRGNTEILKVLIKLGAKINAQDDSGKTPLHWAALYAQGSVVTELLSQGAIPNIQDNEGRTPLHCAARADISNPMGGQNVIGINPFALLSMSGRFAAIVDSLLKKNADPNIADNNGNTPVHLAAQQEAEIVGSLLAKGGDTTIKNKAGKTPKDIARGNERIMKAFDHQRRSE